ncbi:hypothetical protein [Cohnella nanjingensis]|uniref:Uncharacterized protein n=1 Tax=Cohnella nanjingensis TaxID=1387779 RepID=A0A7X0RPU2_9BACL|nr:hypothetical protein [Cohnella nanjingensis]MBB6671432.1 hypothetical protein [Cohnella nanjingensis]
MTDAKRKAAPRETYYLCATTWICAFVPAVLYLAGFGIPLRSLGFHEGWGARWGIGWACVSMVLGAVLLRDMARLRREERSGVGHRLYGRMPAFLLTLFLALMQLPPILIWSGMGLMSGAGEARIGYAVHAAALLLLSIQLAMLLFMGLRGPRDG